MKNFEQFLTGKLIISYPKNKNILFEKAIIYICSQNEDETIGFIINKKLENFSICDTFLSLGIKENCITFHRGGNIDTCKVFIIHTNDYLTDNSIDIDGHIAISSSFEILDDIIKNNGPKKSLIVSGYIQWESKYLIEEIKKNNWWVLNSNEDILFSDDDEKWEKTITQNLKIDLQKLNNCKGTA